MKLSEVFRKAAERCDQNFMEGWAGATDFHSECIIFLSDRVGRESGSGKFPIFADPAHRVLALCMAASIAESEGL